MDEATRARLTDQQLAYNEARIVWWLMRELEMPEGSATRWVQLWRLEAGRRGLEPGPDYAKAGIRWVREQRAAKG